MKLITRDTDYGIRALCYAATNKRKITSVEELVKNLKMPRAFIRKILQILTKEKMLKSYKGQGGGFTLAVLPNKLYLYDLIKIFQGPVRLNECNFKKKVCPNVKICKLKKKIDKLQEYVVGELKRITLASLIEK